MPDKSASKVPGYRFAELHVPRTAGGTEYLETVAFQSDEGTPGVLVWHDRVFILHSKMVSRPAYLEASSIAKAGATEAEVLALWAQIQTRKDSHE